ncbi:MAG: phosphotransferase family protein [Acidimicrobiia bacterium]
MSVEEPVMLNGHLDRPVTLENRGDGPVVVKRYPNGGAAAIHTIMTALWSSPLGEARRPPGVPQPLALEGDRVVMEHVSGHELGTRNEGWDGSHIAELIALVADFNLCGVTVDRQRGATALVRSLRRKHHELTDQGASVELLSEYHKALDALRSTLPGLEPMVLSHGDCSPRNVIVSGCGLRLIDFDRLQMAGPARDVAYLGAWVWASGLLNEGRPSWELGDELLDRYNRQLMLRRDGSASMLIDAVAGTTPFHRSASLLRIAHGWSAMAARPDLAIEVCVEARRLVSVQR